VLEPGSREMNGVGRFRQGLAEYERRRGILRVGNMREWSECKKTEESKERFVHTG